MKSVKAWWRDEPTERPEPATKQREGRFPETRPADLPARYRALRRRRAKNKVAKQSRKANRP